MSRSYLEYFQLGAYGHKSKAAEPGQQFLTSISKSFVETAESVDADSKLTAEGKQAQVEAAARAGLKAIRQGYRKHLDKLQHQFLHFDSTNLFAVTPARGPIDAVTRGELRRHLASLDGTRRREIFDVALQDLDEEILGAYFDRAKIFQLLGQDIIAAGKKRYMQAKCPAVLDAEAAGASLEFAVTQMTHELSEYSGTNEDSSAILEGLPKPGWELEQNGDFEAMKSNQGASVLPDPAPGPASDRRAQHLASVAT